jgi:hypothetical protein
MKYEPSMIPQFISRLEQASSEQEIQTVCLEIKSSVAERYPNENSRRKPMSEIRKAVRERFPSQGGKSPHESAPYPYFFTNSGKGRVERWEHLAIKHLSEEWNKKPESESETESEEIVKTEPLSVVKQELDIFSQVGLNTEELETVKQALGDTDVKEWLKQAVLQRANTINALRDRLEEDLSMVPSQTLMEDKKYRTNPVACRELTSRAVRAIKGFNTQSPEHRWCITNALISELTGNTVKAIAKAVEGMDLESYNKTMGLQPVHNRLTKAAIGDIKDVVSIRDVLGIDG